MQDIHLAKRFYDLAAATSADAYVPVMLALIKMSMLYFSPEFLSEVRVHKCNDAKLSTVLFCDDFDCTFQNFKFSNAFDSLDVRLWLGPNWDLYVMTFLLGVLGLLFLIVQQAR